MAPAQKRTAPVEAVRPSVEGVAQDLIDKRYGPDGPAWGTRLTEFEDLFVAMRRRLSDTMLAEALARQAAAQPQAPVPDRTCPGCQPPLACDDTNERIVQTRAGEAAWAEPEGYCDRCRRSCSPSVPAPGP
jgi:hypothetical protein